MRNLLPYILGILLFGITPSLYAQNIRTLEECVRIALSENISVLTASRQVAISKVNNHGSLAGRYPNIAFNIASQGSLANQQNPASFLNGLIKSGNAAFSVDANWILFEGFRARHAEDRLGQLEAQAISRQQNAVLQTVRAVHLAYLLAELQLAQLGVARESLRLSQEIYAYQIQRSELGQSIRQQLLQSRDALLTDSSSVLLAQLNYNVALVQLRLAMGRPDQEAFDVAGTLSEETPTLLLQDPLQRALTTNPALVEARINREISRLQTQIRRAAYYPRVAVNSGAVWSGNVTGLDGNNPFTGEPFGTRTGTNRNIYAGLQVTLPLFDFGLRRRQVEETRILEEISALTETGIAQEIKARMTTLTETARIQMALYNLSNDQEANARENLDISGERYRMGQLSLFDFRTVQLAFILASQRRLSAWYNLKVTEVDIQFLTTELVR